MFSFGTDAFSDFAPAPIWKALTKAAARRGETLSGTALPCHLSKGGFGKGGKFTAYRLTSMPLTNEDETCPLCQGSPFGEAVEPAD